VKFYIDPGVPPASAASAASHGVPVGVK